MTIAVVVPTIRPEQYRSFRDSWVDQFLEHDVLPVTVWDGDLPRVTCGAVEAYIYDFIPEQYRDLFIPKTASIRNLGFAFVAAKLPQVDVIITLDDDVVPQGDTIGDHLDALHRRVPVSWISTLVDAYPRGFPYGIRDEAEVVMSHGVWEGVLDWDAPSQLILGADRQALFYKGPIPKGICAPFSSMNLAFKRKALPYAFHAPMNYTQWGLDRMDDIWGLLDGQHELQMDGYAAVTGYSRVKHTRASNVFANLRKEGKGIEMNETFFHKLGDTGVFETDPYLKWYKAARLRWFSLLEDIGR